MNTLLNKNFMNLTNFDDLSNSTQIAIYVLIFLLIIFLILLLFVIITNIRRNKRKKEYQEVTQTINTQKSEDANQANENFVVGTNADLKAEEEKRREEEAQKEKLIPTAEALGIDDPMQYSLARLEQLIMMAELKGVRDKNKQEEEKPVTKEPESKPQNEEKKHEHQVFNDKDLGKILDIQLKNQALISNYEKNIKGILKELNNNNNNNNPKEQTPERNERFSEFAKLFIEDRKLKEKSEEKEANKKTENTNNNHGNGNDKALEKIIKKNEMLEEEIRKMKQENFNNEKKRFHDEIKRKEEQLKHERKLLEEERNRVEQRRFADEIENKIMNKISFQTAEIRQMANLMKNNNNRNNEYHNNSNSNNESLLRTIEIELDKLSRKMDYYDKKDYEDNNALTSGQFERKISKNLREKPESKRKTIHSDDDFDYDFHNKNVYENLEIDNNKKNHKNVKSSEKRNNNNKEITQENDKLLETIEIELDLLNKILKENKK